MHWLSQPDALLPDLVFLNSVLPDESGYGVTRLLKARPQFTHTAIIMLLYQNSVVDRLKARLAGAKGCLAIPFGVQNLLQVTQKILSASSSEKSINTRVAINHEHSPLYVVWL
ncbi:hypothetical protein KSX_86210 [Ktedonospora formicarum]|uniref:Response regulatory domain-containing protein n=2 Tax=Ktedonospora formicarum TaxID=2778364 RepID=A0A8J3MY63_9CHLR|nr:hypothetical protein KSX_86210 [Ktedonospora formicarum]